jgi:hypothetical protein
MLYLDKDKSYNVDENGYNSFLSDNKDVSMISHDRHIHSDHHHDADDNSKHYKSQILKLKREVSIIKEERDDALKKLEIANRDIDEMRKSSSEIGRIKALYEHLKQDHESLRISLESSERIRKQQKELISLLQRSQSVTDLSSVVSFNSISTNATPIENRSISSNVTFSSSALAAENRPWLNNFSESVIDGKKNNISSDTLRAGVAEVVTKNKKKLKKSKSDNVPSMLAAVSKSVISSASSLSVSKQRKEMSRLSSGSSALPPSKKRQIANKKITSTSLTLNQTNKPTIMASRRQNLLGESSSLGRPPRYPKK